MKRLLALAASAIAGAAATVLFAAPAQAHHPIISGYAVCQADGQYKITWTVENGPDTWDNQYMQLTKVAYSITNPTANEIDKTFADKRRLLWDEKVVGSQMVPGTTTKAELTVKADWYFRVNDTTPKVQNIERTGTVEPKGICKPKVEPGATFSDRCDGTVSVHIVNPTSRMKSFKVKAGSFTNEVSVEGGKEADVVVPAGSGAITVEVKGGDSNWKKIAEDGGWTLPAACAKPSATGASDCDKFVITLTNPQGNKATTATISYSKEESVELAPGGSEEVSLDLSTPVAEAKVKFSGWPDVTTIKYEKPASCDTLPKTGMDTTTMIASGGGLAVLGGLVFFFARRRMAQLRRMAA